MAGETKRSIEDINREAAEVSLQSAQIRLAQDKKANELYLQAEEQRHKSNAQRQSELKELLKGRRTRQNKCRHMSGGQPKNILKGGGIGSFSLISRSLMPDGVTYLLQCPRCRLKEFTPRKPTKLDFTKAGNFNETKFDAAMEVYEAAKERFDDLFEKSEDAGLAELRGPTFMFKTIDGVPVVPVMV